MLAKRKITDEHKQKIRTYIDIEISFILQLQIYSLHAYYMGMKIIR